MVYTKNTPALLIIGLIMLAIWYFAESGIMEPVIEHLAAGKTYRYTPELGTIPLYFGVVATIFGIWQWFGAHKEGHWDYYSSTIAGGMFILLITMLVRWFIAPEIAVVGTQLGEVGNTGKFIHELLGWLE